MALDLSGLTAYTEENAMDLIAASNFGAKTISLMNVQTGIKSAETINILGTDAIFQAGGSCGFNASGSTTVTQRTITIGKIKVHEAICPKDLEAYYLQKRLAAGSQYDSLAFATDYTALKAEIIAKQMETAVWRGDTTSGDANLSRFDGLIKIIDAAAGVVDATTQADVDSTTIRGIIKDIYTKIPVAIIDKEDVRLFMGWDNFRTLINKLTDDNLFHYTTDEAAKTGEIVYPGSTLRIVAVHGLNSTDRMFALRTSNMYFGTDLENEQERFELFFAKEADHIRFMAEWKAGVQVAFPSEIVSYQNT